MRSPNLEQIEVLIEPVAASIGCELVACEWGFEAGGSILRVFIDKPEGVTVKDCEKLSHLLGPVLDVEDIVLGRYNLEISSPGLERPLKKLKDFERFAGQTIRLKTKIPIEHRSRFKGQLKGLEEDVIVMESDGEVFRIPHKEVEKARLEVDWAQAMKKKKK